MSECTSNEEHYKPHRDTLSGDSIPVSPIAHDDHTHDYLEALVASPSREAVVRSLAFEDRLSVDHFSARNRGSSIPTCHVDILSIYATALVWCDASPFI